MDLRKFDTKKKSDEGLWFDILSPDETEVVFKVKLAGRDSKILKRRQQELAKKKERKVKYSELEAEKDAIETAVICTLDWEDVFEGKVAVEYSVENVRRIYEEFPWVVEQVIGYITDRANFL